MAEGDPLRRRGIGTGRLVVPEATAAGKFLEGGRWTRAGDLEKGQWSVAHEQLIHRVSRKADGDYIVVLEDQNRTEIPVDADDGLTVLPKAPNS